MAPMSLMTYDDARPWARAMKTKVVKREMPPWGADPAIGKFANDVSLKQSEIDTIAAWVDGGAPEGNRAELPKAPQFTEGWSIGKPDLVFKMTEPINVPADGTVPYLYVTVPTNLKEDIWVRGIELKPSDRRVVHHIISDLVEDDGQPDDPKPKLARDPNRKDIGGVGGLVPGRLYTVMEEGTCAEDSGRRRHRAADALHDHRPGGHRPDRDRRDPLEGAAGAECAPKGAARFRTRNW